MQGSIYFGFGFFLVLIGWACLRHDSGLLLDHALQVGSLFPVLNVTHIIC